MLVSRWANNQGVLTITSELVDAQVFFNRDVRCASMNGPTSRSSYTVMAAQLHELSAYAAAVNKHITIRLQIPPILP